MDNYDKYVPHWLIVLFVWANWSVQKWIASIIDSYLSSWQDKIFWVYMWYLVKQLFPSVPVKISTTIHLHCDK